MKHHASALALFFAATCVYADSVAPLAASSGYNTAAVNKLCDGFPQVPLTSIQGTCVGLVASKVHEIKQPRYAAQFDEKTLLVTDMEGWGISNGTVWAIEFPTKLEGLPQDKAQTIKVTNLFPKNNLPNPAGIAVAPNSTVLLGLPTGVMKFSLQRNAKGELQTEPKLETFIDDFDQIRKFAQTAKSMEAYAHPLVNFALSPDYKFIYVNQGSKSDACLKNKTTLPDGKESCTDESGEMPLASVRRYTLDAELNVVPHSGITFAQGLRNSMALAVHSSGLVIQGENARDLSDSNLPSEEINVLALSKDQKPQHYGWPYCYQDGTKVVTSDEFKTRKQECESGAFVPATAPLPGHGAPLGILYPSAKKLPMLKNTLLIGLHGYAANGHRLVALGVDAQGKPVKDATPVDVISDWGSAFKLNPLGAPTGLLEWSDGSIFVMDDKNSAILRLSTGQAVNKKDLKAASFEITEAMAKQFSAANTILKTKCSTCHTDMADADPKASLKALIDSGKLNPQGLEESSLLSKIRYREMPPKTVDPKKFPPLTAKERKLILNDTVRVFE